MTHRPFPIRTMLLSLAIAMPAAATTTTPSTSLAPPPPTPPAQVPATAAANTQVEVLGFLIAIDEQLASMAEQATKRPVDPKVRELALQVTTELRPNAAITRALAVDAKAKLVDTTDITNSRAQAKIALDLLGKVDDANYGSEFLKVFATESSKALDLIDKRLLTDTTDQRVLDHLRASRTLIAAQRLHAQELQATGK